MYRPPVYVAFGSICCTDDNPFLLTRYFQKHYYTYEYFSYSKYLQSTLGLCVSLSEL